MDFLKDNDNGKRFITFPKTLDAYRWYKPIIVFVVGILIFFVIGVGLDFLLGRPTGDLTASSAAMSKPYTLEGIYQILSVALIIPALFIATRIFYKIPFSKQVAPVRNWNWKVFAKTAAFVFAVYFAYSAVDFFLSGKSVNNHFTILTLILCIVVIPIQCFAEEYLFRGFVMQTFGSWFGNPIAAIVLQAIFFAVVHFQYNAIGMASVLFTGLCLGFLAWYSGGLEISSAVHAVNNIYSFLMVGFGIDEIGAGDVSSTFIMMALMIIVAGGVVYFSRKDGWF